MTRSAPPLPAPEVDAPGRAISLADVAALAGVSSGTVSRALSRPQMLSEATRQRVLSAAERLGYVANGAARALALRRTSTIGALVPRLGTSSFPTLVQALEATLAAQGFTLLLAAPDHTRADEAAILRRLLERGVDAVALLGSQHDRETLGLLASNGLPHVMMWGAPQADGACVTYDEAEAAALVVDHLASLGHRRIGFIGGRTAANDRARRRLLGLLQALARQGLQLPAEAQLETDYGFREGFEAMQQLMSRRLPLSAVVCGNDYLAAGALSALDRAGVTVPGAMSVASFNDNDFAAYLHPPLTTVRTPIAEMGAAAGRYLLARLAGQPAPLPGLLPVSLVRRASTGAPTG